MKKTHLFCLLTTFALTINLPTLYSQHKLQYWVNGSQVKPEVLTHMVFCADQGDSFKVSYQSSVPDTADYAIGGLELWAQLTMGQPKLIGQLGFSEPSKMPTMSFTLDDFKIKEALPEGGDAIRVSLRLARVMKVEGRRLLEYVQLKDQERTRTFMVVRACN